MKLKIYLFLVIFIITTHSFYTVASVNSVSPKIYTQAIDSMKYEITKSFSEDDLRKLVKKINKEHNALLSFTNLVINDDSEIVSIELKFIDSQIHESTYIVNENKPIDPIIVYKYGDSISGIKKKESGLLELPMSILERIARQEIEKKERDSLRRVYKANEVKAKNRKPKLRARSSHTVPITLLTKEQKKLRKVKNKDSMH